MSSSTPKESQPRFAIVGAGITGLVLAHGLRKNGFTNVTVFDAEPHIDARPGDWTILLHWGLPVMMSLLPDTLTEARLAEIAMCNPHVNGDPVTETLTAYNGMTGELAFAVPCKGSMRVTRHKLRRALAEMLAADSVIQWSKTLESLDQRDDNSLSLLFEDGSSFDADYVIGADGVSSQVRQLLFAHDPERAKPVSTDLTFAMARVKYGDTAMVQSVLDVSPLTALCFFTGAIGGMGSTS
jgi:2-polyprenyl-6-methoxyphenol hydroxylase-like FAD-dependent oxidoreductase